MLAAMGQSAVIVGDEDLIKVHLHLLRPGDALNYAVGFGALEQIEITNMDLQRQALHGRQRMEDGGWRMEDRGTRSSILHPPSSIPLEEVPEEIAPVGVVAVAPGPGFAAIFRSLNVGAVVGGGQTMNPSTEDLLEAIERLPQDELIVLPNNSNIIMAARQSAQLSSKHVEVLPAKTVPQGIAAMLGFNYQAGITENVRAMTAAIQRVCTAEVTTAVRDAHIDGLAVSAGQTIGLLDGTLVTSGTREAVIDDLIERLDLDNREIVTIYYGQTVERADAEALAARIGERFSELEIEVQEGGQPLYDYIISAE
jgi:dihydroxyacetone kinase-like predicted kinase